jgi:hypothetical protein
LIPFIQTELKFNVGHQSLNDNLNFGTEVGFQIGYYRAKMYYGVMIGYWFDYYTYKVYLQSFIYKRKLSLRCSYDRIDKYDFLNIGLNYTFNRRNNKHLR